ncbi:ST8SIA4 [Branchiostoma lanceolatum]|uniref:ST8SIA4 protein n=1 Tax=Branchiostoma lanceolatum TaxID=7740 RepID=A0A8K0A4X3_BRALA|nr:ST8SIA4 [Branchiostoma lanceolatum]
MVWKDRYTFAQQPVHSNRSRQLVDSKNYTPQSTENMVAMMTRLRTIKSKETAILTGNKSSESLMNTVSLNHTATNDTSFASPNEVNRIPDVATKLTKPKTAKQSRKKRVRKVKRARKPKKGSKPELTWLTERFQALNMSTLMPGYYNSTEVEQMRIWQNSQFKLRRPSTGAHMYALAATICDRIHMYGFYPFSKDPYGANLRYHYYDKSKIIKVYLHNMPEEFRALQMLHQRGALVLHTEPCQ